MAVAQVSDSLVNVEHLGTRTSLLSPELSESEPLLGIDCMTQRSPSRCALRWGRELPVLGRAGGELRMSDSDDKGG